MPTEYIIGKIFDKVLSYSKSKSIDYLKDSILFNQILIELGCSLPKEDTYQSNYIRTLLILNENPEYHRFIPLLKLKEIFESFIESDKTSERNLFIREANKQLHVNKDLIHLKTFNSLPPFLITEFFSTFESCRKDTWTPNDTYIKTRFDQNDHKIDLLDNKINELLKIYPIHEEGIISLEKKINILTRERINQTFENIKKGNVDTGLKELLNLKNDIWNEIDGELKSSITKKIAYCYLEKGDFSIAITFYEEAKRIKKDTGTLSTLALLYHNQGEELKLELILDELDHLDNSKAELIRLRFGKSDQDLDVFYSQAISDKLKDEETLLSLFHFYLKNNQYKKAFEIGSKLVEIFNKIEYKEYASEYGVLYLQSRGIHLGINYLNEDDKIILKKGTVYIKECADYYKGTEILKYKIFIPNYYAIYEMWNENYDEAIEILNPIIKLDPNNYQLLKTLGAIYSKKRDYPKVIEIYDNIPDNSGIEDFPLMKSICYYVLNNFDKAKNVLIEGLKWINNIEIQERTIVQLINYYFVSNDIEGAKKKLDEYENFLSNQSKKIIQAKLYRYNNQTTEARNILIELKNEIFESMEFSPLILEVGNEFEQLEDFDQTIELYEKFANYQQETIFVGSLFDLYIKVGRVNKAIEICESQRKEHINEFYTRNEIAIYYEYKDYDKVIELGKRYVDCFPNNIEIRLYLIHCLSKRRLISQAKDYLRYPFDIKLLNFYTASNLVGAYLEFNLIDEAFETAYKLMAYHNNPEFKSLYIRLGIQKDNYFASLTPQKCIQDVTLFITENGSQKTITFIDRETEDYLQSYYNEIEVNHVVYHKIYGMAPGVQIDISSNGKIFKIEINEIKHRYLYAFQKTLKEFGSLNSDAPFKLFDASSLKDGKLPEFIEKHLEKSAIAQSKIEDCLKFYESGNIPLISISIIFSRDFIDVWKLLTISHNHFIRTSSGNINELNAVVDYIRTNGVKKLLFDLTSLFLLYDVGFVDSIRSNFEIYVLQDVLDDIEEYILKESIGSEKESATLARVDGKNYFIEKPIDIKRNEIFELESFKHWIKANFKIYPPNVLFAISKTELDVLIETLGNATGKSYLISKTTDVLLICDDMALSQAFKIETNKPTAWIQALFNLLLTQEKIDNTSYNELCLKLVERNIKYTHITSEVIYKHFTKSDFVINKISWKIFNILRGGETDNSAFVVAFDFLKKMWGDDEILILKKRKITFEILFSLFINRISIEANSIIRLLSKEMITNVDHWVEIQEQINNIGKYIRIINDFSPMHNIGSTH